MTGRERVAIAMRLGEPDRVPVMCQLAIGHYFLHSGLDPIDIWYSGRRSARRWSRCSAATASTASW